MEGLDEVFLIYGGDNSNDALLSLAIIHQELEQLKFEDFTYMGCLPYKIYEVTEEGYVIKDIPNEIYHRHGLLSNDENLFFKKKLLKQYYKWVKKITIAFLFENILDFFDELKIELDFLLTEKSKIDFLQNLITESRLKIKEIEQQGYGVLSKRFGNEQFSVNDLCYPLDRQMHIHPDSDIREWLNLFLCYNLDRFDDLPNHDLIGEYYEIRLLQTKIEILKKEFENIDSINKAEQPLKSNFDHSENEDERFLNNLESIIKNPSHIDIVIDTLNSVSNRKPSFFQNLFVHLSKKRELDYFFIALEPREYIRIVNESYIDVNLVRASPSKPSESIIRYIDMAINNYMKTSD